MTINICYLLGSCYLANETLTQICYILSIAFRKLLCVLAIFVWSIDYVQLAVSCLALW